MKQFVLFLVCLFVISGFSQQKQKEYKIHTIAFYNLENLFDTINDPNTKDEYSPILEMKIGKDEAYWKKINNMARVISEIGKEITKNSPSIIGLAEIENNSVLIDLCQSKFLLNYDYIHVDSPDWRGIDVALLYQKNSFEPIEFKPFELFAFNEDGYRIKTRDQLLVTGFLENELIHIIINHWPSQRSGKQKTAYLRLKSAEMNLKIIEEIYQENKNAKIISMGDFNDDPIADSFKNILETLNSKEKLKNNNLYNPFEKMFLNGLGTTGFRDNINLFDQIILSGKWVPKNKDYSSYSFYKSGIYNPSYLTQKKGRFKGYPYRSWTQNNTFSGGYSDHYPVYIYVIKEK